MSYWGQNAGFQLRPVMSAQQAQARYQPTQQMPAQPMQRPMQAQVPMQRPMGLLGGSQPGGLLGNPYANSALFNPADPYAAGASANARFTDGLAQRGVAGIDFRNYGGRYNAELSSKTGMDRFASNVHQARANLAMQNGIYKGDDLNPAFSIVGSNGQIDPALQKRYAAIFDQGNGYFISDKAEMNPWQAFAGDTKNPQFDRTALARRYIDLDQNGANTVTENNLRALLDAQKRRGAAPRADGFLSGEQEYQAALSNAARGLVAMDAARGDLNDKQAYAASRVREFQNSVDQERRNRVSIADSLARTQAQLENNTFYDPRSNYSAEQIAQLRSDNERSVAMWKDRLASPIAFEQELNDAKTTLAGLDASKLSSGEIIKGLLGG